MRKPNGGFEWAHGGLRLFSCIMQHKLKCVLQRVAGWCSMLQHKPHKKLLGIQRVLNPSTENQWISNQVNSNEYN